MTDQTLVGQSQNSTAPVTRISLGDDRAPAIKSLLFGPVVPRDQSRTIIKGPGGDAHNATFVLVEAARRPDIDVILSGFRTPYLPLYQGQSADDFARHAPYLAQIEEGSRAADWLIDEGWGSGWGVWLRSPQSLSELRKHFRKFTQLYNPSEERWFIFRFYAPETVRRVIPMLPPHDFAEFTQGLSQIVTSDASGRTALVI